MKKTIEIEDSNILLETLKNEFPVDIYEVVQIHRNPESNTYTLTGEKTVKNEIKSRATQMWTPTHSGSHNGYVSENQWILRMIGFDTCDFINNRRTIRRYNKQMYKAVIGGECRYCDFMGVHCRLDVETSFCHPPATTNRVWIKMTHEEVLRYIENLRNNL